MTRVIILLGLLLFGSSPVAAVPEAIAKPAMDSKAPAVPMPSLKVTTLDGKPFDLVAQRGHWVAEIKDFLVEHPVSYPIAQVDPAEPVGDFETPRGLPTTYLIDPEGHIAKRFIGPVDSASLSAAIGTPVN